MQVEKLISITWSQKELRDLLIADIEGKLNETIPGSPEYKRRMEILEHARAAKSYSLEWQGDRFYFAVDGVMTPEEL